MTVCPGMKQDDSLHVSGQFHDHSADQGAVYLSAAAKFVLSRTEELGHECIGIVFCRPEETF